MTSTESACRTVQKVRTSLRWVFLEYVSECVAASKISLSEFIGFRVAERLLQGRCFTVTDMRSKAVRYVQYYYRHIGA